MNILMAVNLKHVCHILELWNMEGRNCIAYRPSAIALIPVHPKRVWDLIH